MWNGKRSGGHEEGEPADDGLARLLARMAEGDESALERFYDLTSRRAYAFVVRIVRDPHLAEDVVEEAYFQMWRKAADYDAGRGAPLAWLYTLCRSRALDSLRRRDDEELYDDPAELEARMGSDENDPYSLLDAMDRSSAVHAALASLSPQARQVVSLAFFRGLSHSEIATVFQMPLGTVKTTINRACDKMRGHIIAHAGAPS